MAELSGLEVLVLTEEIDEALRGCYVNNIFRIGEAQIFRFRGPGGSERRLIVSPRVGAWLSEKVSEREETTEFTTRLRRILERAKFVRASQLGLDRVYVIEMMADRTVRLVLELMPPGNLVVTDAEGRILLTKDDVRTPRRRVVRGEVYSPPRERRLSPESVTAKDVAEMAEAEKTVGQAVGKHISLPSKYVKELLARVGLSEGSPASLLSGKEDELVSGLQGLVGEARGSPAPCIAEAAGGPELMVVAPMAFRVLEKGATLSALCDEVLLGKVLQESQAPSPGDRMRLEAQEKAARLKEEGEAFLVRASEARAMAAAARTSPSVAEAMKEVEGLALKPMREPASPEAVASMAYDRAKELEAKSKELARAAKKLRAKAPKAGAPRSGRARLPPKGREWYEKFRWFRTSGGKLAIGGRDAASNSILVRRHLEDGDTVFHASLFGSPFFILKGGKEQTEEEVKEVAQATVAFSSAWKTGLGAADAFWVLPGQVSAAAPSGEYLARGSFAISGRKNQVPKNIVEVAAGQTDEGQLTAGPESAFRGRSPAYVVLRPHREKSSDTAKSVLHELVSMLGGPPPYGVDDLLRVLPSGGGKVVRKAKALP